VGGENKEQLSDVNTLSLSGLLNALDGVAAREVGSICVASGQRYVRIEYDHIPLGQQNHLERLDPALCRLVAWMSGSSSQNALSGS